MTTSLWPVETTFATVDRKEQHLELAADPSVRSGIAKLLDLQALDRFEARVHLAKWLDGALIKASWSADLVQLCGVTLEPIETALEGRFEIRLLPPGSPNAPAEDAEMILDLDAEDPPDVLESETIPVGDYLVEQLALSIDPFPRKAGAVFTPPDEGKITPFAALAALKAKGGGGAGE